MNIEAKILIVEDETDLCDLLSEWLSAFDCQITIANNVSEAWSALVKNNYSMVLSDINLGSGPTGLDLYDLCKKHLLMMPTFNFITASAEIYQAKLNETKSNVIKKPFNLKDLEDAVTSAINQFKNQPITRRHVRFKGAGSLTLVPPVLNSLSPIKLINLSRGGFLAELKAVEVKAEELCQFTFNLIGQSEMTGLARVKWINNIGANSWFGGFEFIEFQKGEEQWIEYALILEGAR